MSLAKSFVTQIEPQQPVQIDMEEVTGKPKQMASRKAKAAVATTRGKSSNPDYEAVKVLVKSEYRTKATRKWEDDQGRHKDFSDLIEHLLTKYIGA